MRTRTLGSVSGTRGRNEAAASTSSKLIAGSACEGVVAVGFRRQAVKAAGITRAAADQARNARRDGAPSMPHTPSFEVRHAFRLGLRVLHSRKNPESRGDVRRLDVPARERSIFRPT